MKISGLVFVLVVGCSRLFAVDSHALYKVHDASLPDITVPQPQAQVIPPQVFAQLGSQDRALQDIDQEVGELKANIKTLQDDVKPLQETDIRVRFLLSILGWLIGIVLTSGLGGWVFHWLSQKRKSPPKRKSGQIQTGSVKF